MYFCVVIQQCWDPQIAYALILLLGWHQLFLTVYQCLGKFFLTIKCNRNEIDLEDALLQESVIALYLSTQ